MPIKFKFVDKPEYSDQLRTIEMDEKPVFLGEEDSGFKTFGVTSCIVFVAYVKDQLTMMYHWSTPSSDAKLSKVFSSVEYILGEITVALEDNDIDLEEVTVYAIGGQESSQHCINFLHEFANEGTSEFALDTTHLHKVHDEDCFDLYVLASEQKFYAVHHRCDKENENVFDHLLTPQKTLLSSLKQLHPEDKVKNCGASHLNDTTTKQQKKSLGFG